MQKKLVALGAGLVIFGMAGMAKATLTTIGTATYNGSDYKLIWDDDNNGNSVVWLDYSNEPANWQTQKSWAAGLVDQLTYHIDAPYHVSWLEDSWRLPSTVDGLGSRGYYITTSEMGHLFYEELGAPSSPAPPFDHLKFDWSFGPWGWQASYYWSGTEYGYPVYAWYFSFSSGLQNFYYKRGTYATGYGLALRNAKVSELAPVPEPATALLLSSGLAALAGYKRRRKNDRA